MVSYWENLKNRIRGIDKLDSNSNTETIENTKMKQEVATLSADIYYFQHKIVCIFAHIVQFHG